MRIGAVTLDLLLSLAATRVAVAVTGDGAPASGVGLFVAGGVAELKFGVSI